MSYYFSTVISDVGFDEVTQRVTDALKSEGFGVLNQIDMHDTLREKIGVDFRKYRILGACNPHFAHKALQLEGKLGVLLPCNVVVEDLENGSMEVSFVDPLSMMSSVGNKALDGLSEEVREKFKRVVGAL